MTRGGRAPAQFEDPDRLADAIIERVGKNIVLALPLGLGKANHVANALFARAAADPSINLRIFTALTLEKPHPRQELERRFVGPLAQRVFGGYPELAYAVALHKNRLPPNVEVDEFFFQAGNRLAVPASQQSYISANYTHALRYVLDRGVNVVGQLVAKRVRDGETRYSLSCNTDITLDLLARRRAGRLRVSVRRAGQFGAAVHARRRRHRRRRIRFHAGRPATDFPLFAPPREPVDLAEYAAGLHAARIVADGGTLQLGIGSLGDAVAQALILRHRHNAAFRDILARLDPPDTAPTALREGAPFEIGLHGVSEMFVEGFLDLMRAGILKREVDGTLAAGGVLRRLARVLSRAARDAGAGAGQAADDGDLLRQRALRRRRARQAARARQGALHQQRHDGDPARRTWCPMRSRTAGS